MISVLDFVGPTEDLLRHPAAEPEGRDTPFRDAEYCCDVAKQFGTIRILPEFLFFSWFFSLKRNNTSVNSSAMIIT